MLITEFDRRDRLRGYSAVLGLTFAARKPIVFQINPRQPPPKRWESLG
jgi:hypothetical protein